MRVFGPGVERWVSWFTANGAITLAIFQQLFRSTIASVDPHHSTMDVKSCCVCCQNIALQCCNAEDEPRRLSQILAPNSCNQDQAKEVENGNNQIKILHEIIHHLEVHCYLYQQALMNVKNGLFVWQQIKEEARDYGLPICHHCGTEQLLLRIAKLREKVANLKASNED